MNSHATHVQYALLQITIIKQSSNLMFPKTNSRGMVVCFSLFGGCECDSLNYIHIYDSIQTNNIPSGIKGPSTKDDCQQCQRKAELQDKKVELKFLLQLRKPVHPEEKQIICQRSINMAVMVKVLQLRSQEFALRVADVISNTIISHL